MICILMFVNIYFVALNDDEEMIVIRVFIMTVLSNQA